MFLNGLTTDSRLSLAELASVYSMEEVMDPALFLTSLMICILFD
jgi:hypothetical protein